MDWVLTGSQTLPQSMGKRPLQFFGGTAALDPKQTILRQASGKLSPRVRCREKIR